MKKVMTLSTAQTLAHVTPRLVDNLDQIRDLAQDLHGNLTMHQLQKRLDTLRGLVDAAGHCAAFIKRQ